MDGCHLNLNLMYDISIQISGMISYDRWWLFTWFVMIPVTIASGVNAWIVENEHLSHGPPPYIPYDHLEIRVSTSKFNKQLTFYMYIPGGGPMAKWRI